ncbi:MAG: winged helix-turn-helix domain-containing protein [Candidatus Thorarchaeota archaeon]
MIEISKDLARQFVLDIQGLRTEKPAKSVLDVAKRIHNIQIDTISVVSRSHNLITYNRLQEYTEGDLWKYLERKKLFEYWSHALCLMPMKSYPFYAWVTKSYPEKLWSYFNQWASKNQDIIQDVYRIVKANGPTASQDVGKREGRSKGWWDMKAERMALDYLFYEGKVMVSFRKGFQKYFDLTERVLPPNINHEPLSEEEVPVYLVDTILSSLGIASYRDIKSYMGTLAAKELWGGRRNRIEDHLDERVKDGDIVEIKIPGFVDRNFTTRKYARILQDMQVSSSDRAPVKLLSPFDNILRERHYPRQLWDFDYTLECYTPPKKRVYGYYVLPILDQNDLRGRVDAKVHRQRRTLELISVYLESPELHTPEALNRFIIGMKNFAAFHYCEAIEVGKVYPVSLQEEIKQNLLNTS